MAKRVNFTAKFIYTPSNERRVSTTYKAGMRNQLVTEECADKAIALGCAVLAGDDQPGAPKVRPYRTRTAGPRVRRRAATVRNA